MDTQGGFDVALQQLAVSVSALEVGDLGVDGTLKQYEQSVKLLRYCYGLLDGAERTVALLKGVDADGLAETTAFDGAEASPSVATLTDADELDLDGDDIPY